MGSSFQILYSVEITHSFYRSERCPDFNLVPTEACRKLLRNHNLLVRSLENGLQVLFEKSLQSEKAARKIDRPAKFSFLMVLDNPNFRTFTLLREKTSDFPGKSLYYFSNLDQESGAIDFDLADGKMSLIKSIPVGEIDRVKVLPARFLLPVDPDQHNEIKIFSCLPHDGKSLVWQADVEPPARILPVDLSRLSPGRYSCHYLGADPQQLALYVDSTLFSKTVFGLIEIYVDATSTAYSNSIRYFVEFERKEELWSYYISQSEEQYSSELGIEVKNYSGKQTFPFTLSPNVLSFAPVPYSEQTAMEKAKVNALVPRRTTLFKSSRPLPLYEYGLPVRLELNKSVDSEEADESRTEILLNRLPTLSPQALSPEIFVNI